MTINYERIREEWKEFVSQKCSVLEIYKKGGYDKKIADYWLNILSQEVEKARKEERQHTVLKGERNRIIEQIRDQVRMEMKMYQEHEMRKFTDGFSHNRNGDCAVCLSDNHMK